MNTKQLIQKFWSGYASPKEKQQLLDQLEITDHELKADLQEEFDQQPTLLSERLSPEQKKKVYDRLITTIGDQSARKKQSLSRIIVKIAASLLLVAGGVSIIWENQQDFVHTSVTVLPLQKRIVSSTSVFVRHILPDGTSEEESPSLVISDLRILLPGCVVTDTGITLADLPASKDRESIVAVIGKYWMKVIKALARWRWRA